jgi:HK97 family phage prohead protease
VRMLWQHDPGEPIGRWLSITEDTRGLHVRGRLNLAVARAREIHALMRDGAVDGLSIGFRVERASPDRASGLRRLEKLDLWEISLVTFPMLPGARVGAVKHEDLAGRIRRFAALLPLAGRSWRWGCERRLSPRRHPHPSPPRKGEGTSPAQPRFRHRFAAPE